MITFTKEAISKLKEFAEKETDSPWVRVGVKGGGCSGFTYSMGYTEEEDYDEVKLRKFEQDGITCIIDKASESFIAGITVDWHEDLMKRGFVFNNPNATGSCGCGKSFSV